MDKDGKTPRDATSALERSPWQHASSRPADGSGTMGVEAFDAAYGAGFQVDDYDSPHALDCELVEDGGAFEAHRPPAVAARPRRVAFVDGTMRSEARLERIAPPSPARSGPVAAGPGPVGR